MNARRGFWVVTCRTLGPPFGTANFLYSDGDTLFAHAHRRCWDEGDGRFSEPRPPGLSHTRLQGLVVPGLDVSAPAVETQAVLVASVPLTEQGWQPLAEGSWVALSGGQLLMHGETSA